MRIREATAADAAAMSELADQLGYRASPAAIRERLPETTARVAELDGRVVGWIQVERRPMLTTGPIAEVTALVVDAGCRGQGVGAALLEWAEAWAAGRALGSVRIRCNTARAETHRFYERRGYREIKTQKVFEKAPR